MDLLNQWAANYDDGSDYSDENESDSDSSDESDFSDEEIPECDFDEETYLKEYDPSNVDSHFMGDLPITYQFLLELAEMTSQLIGAWKKRSAAAENIKEKYQFRFSPHVVGVTLYQLDPQDRQKLRNNSVKCLKSIFGDKEEILRFEAEIVKIVKFLKKTLLFLLESCLPSHLPHPTALQSTALPYPVLISILSHLLAVKGVAKLGLVTKEEESRWMERNNMDHLYHYLADVYDNIKNIMFRVQAMSDSMKSDWGLRKDELIRSFKHLAEIVNSSMSDTVLDVTEENVLEGGMDMERSEIIVEAHTSRIQLVRVRGTQDMAGRSQLVREGAQAGGSQLVRVARDRHEKKVAEGEVLENDDSVEMAPTEI